MKKGRKAAFILSMIFCLLVGDKTILASESEIIEVPQNQIEVYTTTEDFVDTMSSPSLSGCTLEIGAVSNGVNVTFITRATQTADEIGVRNVVLQEKTWYGWKDIPISDHKTNNTDIYAGGVVYTSAEAGKTYRVYCTHYAKFGSTEDTVYNITGELVYN